MSIVEQPVLAAPRAVLNKKQFAPVNAQGYGPIHVFCASGDLNNLEQTLRLCNVDAADKRGNTGLHWAVRYAQARVICLLVDKYSANVNAQNADGETPLHISIREGRADIATYLLQNNADANIAALDGTYPLHSAVASGRLELAQLLVKYGAWLECEDMEAETPLFYAVRENQLSMVEWLLRGGASAEHKNEDGETVFTFAREVGSPTLIKLFAGFASSTSTGLAGLAVDNDAEMDDDETGDSMETDAAVMGRTSSK